MADMSPEPDTPPPRWWRRQRWLRAPLLLAPVAVAVGLWLLTRPQPPTRQEVEQEVAAHVGESEHTTVTATCTVPDTNGYTCTLRDVAGRYGYTITSFTKHKPSGNSRYSPAWDTLTTWGFPLNADGTGTLTLNATPPGNLPTSITGALEMIGASIGRPNLLDLYGAIRCDDQVTNDVTTCTVRAPVLSATVHALGNYKYELTYRVALPTS